MTLLLIITLEKHKPMLLVIVSFVHTLIQFHDTEALQTISPLFSWLLVRSHQQRALGDRQKGRRDWLHSVSITSSNWFRQQLVSDSTFFNHQNQPYCSPSEYQQQPGRTLPLRGLNLTPSPSQIANGAPSSEVRDPTQSGLFFEFQRISNSQAPPSLHWLEQSLSFSRLTSRLINSDYHNLFFFSFLSLP